VLTTLLLIVKLKDPIGFIFVDSNNIMSNITIKNLTFLNCGQDISTICSASCRAAIAFDTVDTLFISGITVNYSTGWGMYTNRLLGSSLVVNSTFANNSGTSEYNGGNIDVNYTDCSADTSVTLRLTSLNILYGNSSHYYPVASGLCLFLECTNVNISISNVTMIGNKAISRTISTGGNIAIIYRNYTNLVINSVTVQDSYIANGSAYQGAGMFVSIFEATTASMLPANVSQTIAQSLHVSNTHFIGNHAQSLGGLYIVLHEMPFTYVITGELVFENCTFSHNTLSPEVKWVGGTAVHIQNDNVPEYMLHGIPQFNVSFSGCKFLKNSLNSSKHCSGSATVFVIKKPSGTYFINCTFEQNACSALTAVQSILVFQGNVTMQGNSGTDGGGLVLCDRSYIYLKPYTNITLDSNRAWHSGGGIYADDECLETFPLCFFQLDKEIIYSFDLLRTVHIKMINNTAVYAGSDLYGGSVDYCYVPGVGAKLLLKPTGPQIFKKIFEFHPNTSDLSYISSNPSGICFCQPESVTPNCNISSHNVTVYPGEMFSLSVVVVGQRNGTVPGDIHATLQSRNSSLGAMQEVQNISTTKCGQLNYTVYSHNTTEDISLQAQSPKYSSGIYFHRKPQKIKVSLKPCPPGFMLKHKHPFCDCAQLLANNDISCSISNQTIHRPSPVWIGYHSDENNNCSDNVPGTRVIFHHHCPFDFCLPHDVNIKVSDSNIMEDDQCDFNRTGILCGGCTKGLSLALGTSKCIHCTNYWLLLLVVFLLAGAALVLLLIACNLTVTEGTIGGLIFYANIVQANSAIFFPHKNVHFLTDFLTVFISWLNLDLGVQVCFYDGMDAYSKAWLQFVFPVYIWLITILIIVLSRLYRRVALAVGRNGVKVLATLFLLSYAKLLRAIMAALSFTFINFPNNSTKVRWLHDGNTPYLHGKHIPLFVVAVVFGIISLPYTFSLLFIQFLQKNSHMRMFTWVNKLKPIVDAYTGPHNNKYYFWTGMLLLLRCILFTTFELNILGTSGVNLLAIVVACMCILPFIRGVYRTWQKDILEFSFVLNLGIFSSATAYVHSNGGSQVAVATISTTIAFGTFIGILLLHAYKNIQVPQICNIPSLHMWVQNQRETGTLTEPALPSNNSNEEEEHREPLLTYGNT